MGKSRQKFSTCVKKSVDRTMEIDGSDKTFLHNHIIIKEINLYEKN